MDRTQDACVPTTPEPMKIFTNTSYSEPVKQLLSEGTAGHQCTDEISEAEIIFGFTDPATVKNAPALCWIQVPAAGYEKYDNAEARAWLQERGIVLTNSSSVYNEPCAQHVLAMMMALARRLPDSQQNQSTTQAWPQWETRAETYLLAGQTVLLLSYGAIARRLCELLAPLKLNLIAVRRTPTGDEPIKTITEAELSAYLPTADHVVNILPANPQTNDFVNAERFAAMKRGAKYYSIGRGTTTDQDALLAALQTGQLSEAYLDVTNPEPLPADHPLWKTPNCYITPHTAGGHSNEQERLVKLFLENLKRFVAGEELQDRIV